MWTTEGDYSLFEQWFYGQRSMCVFAKSHREKERKKKLFSSFFPLLIVHSLSIPNEQKPKFKVISFLFFFVYFFFFWRNWIKHFFSSFKCSSFDLILSGLRSKCVCVILFGTFSRRQYKGNFFSPLQRKERKKKLIWNDIR